MAHRLCFFFLVPVAAAFAGPLLLTQAAPPPQPSVLHVSFNLATDTYDDMYSRLQAVLRRPSKVPYKVTDVMGKHVLGPRRPNFYDKPNGWIMVRVVGGAPEDKVTLALADDDLYVLGFSNSSDHWHELDGPPTGLPGATKLPFQRSYGDLIGGGHENLFRVRLGKQSAIVAARALGRYGGRRAGRITTTMDQARDGMVRFVVMVSEATRFQAIRAAFAGRNWERETHITPLQSKYVVQWGQLSRLLLEWKESRYSVWGGTNKRSEEIAEDVAEVIGVRNASDALAIIDFLLRRPEV